MQASHVPDAEEAALSMLSSQRQVRADEISSAWRPRTCGGRDEVVVGGERRRARPLMRPRLWRNPGRSHELALMRLFGCGVRVCEPVRCRSILTLWSRRLPALWLMWSRLRATSASPAPRTPARWLLVARREGSSCKGSIPAKGVHRHRRRDCAPSMRALDSLVPWPTRCAL